MAFSNTYILVGLSVISLLTGCGDVTEGENTSTSTDSRAQVEVSGAAQKGPFIVGSSVTINTLSDTGTPTNETIITHTTDDIGDFDFQVDAAKVVQIEVQGYNFNEILGRFSDSTLTLRAVYIASSENKQTAYVNVLTHIIYNRVISKMKIGTASAIAISEAESEFISSFKDILDVDSLRDFTNLSVYNVQENNDKGNAYLLALSAILYQYSVMQSAANSTSVDAELTLVLNKLANDLSDDGAISNSQLLTDLISASQQVNPGNIKENLESHSFQAMGRILSVPDLDKFIDTDLDGQVNFTDDDDDGDGILDTADETPYGINAGNVSVTAPAENDKVSDTITIKGTTNKFVQQVKVKIGDGPFIEASGTTDWQISVNTKNYTDGATNIVVHATLYDWSYSEVKIPVTISNIDPIVGSWSCTRTDSTWANPTKQWFSVNGSLNDVIFSCWVKNWERDGDRIIINRYNCGNISFIPKFSDNNNQLSLKYGNSVDDYRCVRQ